MYLGFRRTGAPPDTRNIVQLPGNWVRDLETPGCRTHFADFTQRNPKWLVPVMMSPLPRLPTM